MAITHRGSGEFLGHRAGDDHQVRLPWRRPEDDPETVQVVARAPRRDHLDGAARDAEGFRPQRRFPAPVDEAINGAEEDVVAESIF